MQKQDTPNAKQGEKPENKSDAVAPWCEYLVLLSKIGKVLDDLAELESNKTRAVNAGEATVVDEIMKKEQAFSLSLRGMEQKRQVGFQKLGIPPCPLNQLMNHVPRSIHLEAKKVVEIVQGQYANFQSASELARSALEVSLHRIDVITGQVEGGYQNPNEGEELTQQQKQLAQRIRRKAPGVTPSAKEKGAAISAKKAATTPGNETDQEKIHPNQGKTSYLV